MALVGAGAVVAGAFAARGDGVLDTSLVSRASGAAGAVGDGSSSGSRISANGRYVAFVSNADNLDLSSNDSVRDVFVRDLQANTTRLVSRASRAAGAPGNGDSGVSAISANGRYVAFVSDATNLDAASNDAVHDVFVRDLVANTTTLVSRASGTAGPVGDDDSTGTAISPNGRYVAFSSRADNLDPDSNDTVQDVFVRDRQANTTTLVSRASDATGAVGDGDSFASSISAGARYVGFVSAAGNLDPDSNDAVLDAFVRDRLASTTTLVSRAGGATGPVADDSSFAAMISANGRYVAFDSNADNLDPDSNDAVADVFIRDLATNTTTLASRASGQAGEAGDGGSSIPWLSPEGRYLAFESTADNLDSDSNDALIDVFVRDLQANVTRLASRATGAGGAVSDGDSIDPSVSAGGGLVVFTSDADNLDSASNDTVNDVFARELIDPRIRCRGRAVTRLGTPGPDRLRGTRRRDVVAGLGGSDVIRGLAGDDLLCGGKGRDRLLGARGRDRLLGQRGNDHLGGGPARDQLKGGPGRDRLLGGPGRDLLRGGPGGDLLRGGPGVDRQTQ